MVISPAPSSHAASMMAIEQYCATIGALSARAIRTRVSLHKVDISIVDHVPEELVVMHLDKVVCDYDMNVGAGARMSYVGVKLHQLQMDDEQWSSPLPVILVGLPLHGSIQPMSGLLSFTMLSETALSQGRRRIPHVNFEAARPLQLAISEQLGWRLLELYESLRLERLYGSTSRKAHDVSSSALDPILEIDLMSIFDVQGKCFFRSAPNTRPRKAFTYVPESYLQMVPESLDSVKLYLEGREIQNVNMRSSLLWDGLRNSYRGQILSFGFSLLYSALGFLGTNMTGQMLGVASSKMKRLVGEKKAASTSNREVTNLADGMAQGVLAFGDGLFRGIKGVVSKPIQGAQSKGAVGFIKGVTQGVVGVVANPVSGALDAVSSGLLGFNATLNTLSGGSEMMATRRRIQRSVRGDRVLTPFDVDDALGQGLLRCAVTTEKGLTPFLASSQRPSATAYTAKDMYEHYFVLPETARDGPREGPVALLTNHRLLMIHAPEFVGVSEAVKAGNNVSIDRLAPGEVKWHMEWNDVLATELIWNSSQRPGSNPQKLVLHSRNPRGPLLHEIVCDVASGQAIAMQRVIQALLHKYVHEVSRRYHVEDEGGSSQEESAVPQEEGQMMPLEMPSIEWILILLTPRLHQSGDVASIWRPIGPARYCRLGDVIRKGREPPAAPVSMYRDDSRGGEAGAMFAAPLSFNLVWREFEGKGLTIWRAQPPQGYVAIGCMAAKGLDPPPLSAMRCVREDLTKSTPAWSSPTWWAVSSDPGAWHVSCWQIDAPSNPFVAVRSHKTPPRSSIRDIDLSSIKEPTPTSPAQADEQGQP